MSNNIGEISRPTFSKQMNFSQTLPGSNGPSKSQAMQLGAIKATTKLAFGDFPTELADEIDEDKAWATPSSSSHLRSEAGHNPWGTDDLIDVNADEDDWSEFNTPSCQTEFTELSLAPAKGAFESAPAKTLVTAVDHTTRSLSRETGSSRMTDRGSPGFESRHGGQISQTTPTQLGKAATSTQRAQSPALFSGTKSPPEDLGWNAVGIWESPLEKVPTASTCAPASQAVVSKEEKALEMARRKEERKQVCRLPKLDFDQLNTFATLSSASPCSRSKRKSPVEHECWCYKPLIVLSEP
jgi:SCY1-like protein 1